MAAVKDKIRHMHENRDSHFGNARDVRNLYEKIWKNMVARVVANNLEGEERKRIIEDDIKGLLL